MVSLVLVGLFSVFAHTTYSSEHDLSTNRSKRMDTSSDTKHVHAYFNESKQ